MGRYGMGVGVRAVSVVYATYHTGDRKWRSVGQGVGVCINCFCYIYWRSTYKTSNRQQENSLYM